MDRSIWHSQTLHKFGYSNKLTPGDSALSRFSVENFVQFYSKQCGDVT